MEALGKALQPIMARAKSRSGMSFDGMSRKEFEALQVKWLNETEGTLHELDGYECRECRNKGYIVRLVEDNGRLSQVSRDCKCAEIRRSIARMKKSGLKDIIHDYTFEKFETSEPWQKAIKDAAMDYAEHPDGWFFLGGQSGAGKTHLCTAICRKFLLEGKVVQYMMWRDDIAKIKSVAMDYDELSQLMQRFKTAEVLYIDDLFKTGKAPEGKGMDSKVPKPTSADINYAFEIINYRYNAGLPTIISSELTESEMLEIDEATIGRIYEKAKTFSISKDRSRNYRLRNTVTL